MSYNSKNARNGKSMLKMAKFEAPDILRTRIHDGLNFKKNYKDLYVKSYQEHDLAIQ